MPREDASNPYRKDPYRKEACPGLHAAWDEGFRASLAGAPVPEKHLLGPPETSNAWLNGQTAARLSGQPTGQMGPDDRTGSPARKRTAKKQTPQHRTPQQQTPQQ